MNRFLKKAVASVLAVTMAFGGTVSAFADGNPNDVNGDGKVTLVAFGDSMANGYGLDGYENNNGYMNQNKDLIVNMTTKFENTPNSYVKLFGEYLDADNIYDLAVSGYRAEDVHAVLTDDADVLNIILDNYNSDNDGIFDKNWRNLQSVHGGSNDAEVWVNTREAWYEYINEADVITLALGNNNFGTFMTSRLCALLSQFGFDLGGTMYDSDWRERLDAVADPRLASVAKDVYSKLFNYLMKQFEAQGVGAEMSSQESLTQMSARCSGRAAAR